MVVRVVLDQQFNGSGFETTSWPKGQFRLSSCEVWSKEYQEHLRTYWFNIILLLVALQLWGISTLSMKRGCKYFSKSCSYWKIQYIGSESDMHWKYFQLCMFCFFLQKIWVTKIFIFHKEFSSLLIGQSFVWLKWQNFWEVTWNYGHKVR